MRRTMAAIATLGMLLAAFGLVAGPADADDLSFSIGYSVKRGAPGTSVGLGGTKVPADLQGRTCDVVLMSENNSSIHPGNDVIITSDGSVVFADVENSRAMKVYPAQSLKLGARIGAQLRFGKNGVTSSGFEIKVDCPPPPTTTVPPTTVPVTTTVPPVTTTVPPVTTTEPPATTVPPTTAKPPATTVAPPTVFILPPAEPATPMPVQPTFTG